MRRSDGKCKSVIFHDEVLQDRLREAHRLGLSARRTAEHVGYSERTIVRWRKALGLTQTPAPVREGEVRTGAGSIPSTEMRQP